MKVAHHRRIVIALKLISLTHKTQNIFNPIDCVINIKVYDYSMFVSMVRYRFKGEQTSDTYECLLMKDIRWFLRANTYPLLVNEVKLPCELNASWGREAFYCLNDKLIAPLLSRTFEFFALRIWIWLTKIFHAANVKKNEQSDSSLEKRGLA